MHPSAAKWQPCAFLRRLLKKNVLVQQTNSYSYYIVISYVFPSNQRPHTISIKQHQMKKANLKFPFYWIIHNLVNFPWILDNWVFYSLGKHIWGVVSTQTDVAIFPPYTDQTVTSYFPVLLQSRSDVVWTEKRREI